MADRITVKRDGNVYRGDVLIGKVTKTQRETMVSMIVGGDGETVWHCHTVEGKDVTNGGQTTRKRAVHLLDIATRPNEVSDVRLGTDYFSGKTFIHASVRWEGNYMGVSSYAEDVTADGRRLWAVDSIIPLGAFLPSWSHGEGDRTVRKQCLAPEIADVVTENAAEHLRGILANA